MLIWIQPITLCSNFKEWESGLTGKESVSHSCLDLKFKNLFPTWKVDNTCQENVDVQNMRRYLHHLYSAVYKEQFLLAQMIYIRRLYQGCFVKVEILTDRGTRLTDWQIKVQFQGADIVLAQKSNNNNRDGIMTGGFSTSKYSINQNQQPNSPISFSQSEICPLYWSTTKYLCWPLKCSFIQNKALSWSSTSPLFVRSLVIASVNQGSFSSPKRRAEGWCWIVSNQLKTRNTSAHNMFFSKHICT